MLSQIIRIKTRQWLESGKCTALDLLRYIRSTNKLRQPQIEAIETYLYLKIACDNKPLWQLFAEGNFTKDSDYTNLKIKYLPAFEYFSKNPFAKALFHFTHPKDGEEEQPELAQLILDNYDTFDYEKIIKSLFYNVDYPDYLMSLPMGAGKTFLMAAFIYLDLYFALNEPENKNFAHNFLVMIPSGLKSSIIPSLKTIEHFDPSWILPEPAASEIKRLIHFEILDEQKTAQKSNKARNPNAQKVNQILPNPFGYIFVVNAEKVILNKVDLNAQKELIEKTEDEKDLRANELRNLIGKIPNLSILIDEVHHAAKNDIKLRQVVNRWQKSGNITTVLGFSGTPYLTGKEKIPVNDDINIKLSIITNTVYYYPLTEAIRQFLKTPKVKIGDSLDHLEIIKKGIEEFNDKYKDKTYPNGTIPKLAIYCSNIEMLEEEIFPFLISDLKIDEKEILKYHGGNKKYSLPKENELEFNSLDLPISKKRYILLVAIGKEGWDCRSLTSVILPQKSPSASRNKIIQTSCRCLRQVDKNTDETALIWLNRQNADILNKQLQKEQNTNIDEINNLTGKTINFPLQQHSRVEHLKLPKVDFYQLRVNYLSIEEEEKIEIAVKLQQLSDNLPKFKNTVIVTTTTLNNLDDGMKDFISRSGKKIANYNAWIFEIAKESFTGISTEQLHQYDNVLKTLFNAITYKEKGQLLFNELYDRHQINSHIRLAFHTRKYLKTESEIIPEKANLLVIDKLNGVDDHDKLYPDQEETNQILKFDKNPMTETEFENWKNQKALELLSQKKNDDAMHLLKEKRKPIIDKKDHSFHYLPYDFHQSKFEMDILKAILNLTDFMNNKLEIYYNGRRSLTEFKINCYGKSKNYWRNIGQYTPDFLVLKRQADNSIHQALILETKGQGFANDPVFRKKRNFVETEFLKQNNEKFGYNRFDFLYIEDTEKMNDTLAKINEKINQFFGE